MSTTADLVTALKKELKSAQMTYADLAQALGMAESSIKRMLAKGDMPLSRVDASPSFRHLDTMAMSVAAHMLFGVMCTLFARRARRMH